MFDNPKGAPKFRLQLKSMMYAWHEVATEVVDAASQKAKLEENDKDYFRGELNTIRKRLLDFNACTIFMAFDKAGDDGLVQSKIIEDFSKATYKTHEAVARDIARRFEALAEFDLIKLSSPQQNIVIAKITDYGLEMAAALEHSFDACCQ